MEQWDSKEYVEDFIEKTKVYDLYHDLCLRLDVPPISRDEFVDKYVDIIRRHEELYEQAKRQLPKDKETLLGVLENIKAPLEDIVTIDSLPPSVTIPLNIIKGGMICLFVLFPNGPGKPFVIPSYLESGSKESVFL